MHFDARARAFLGVVLITWLAAPPVAVGQARSSVEAVKEPLAPDGSSVVLRGLEATFVRTLELGPAEDRRSQPVLEFTWEASELLVLTDSVLSVAVNDVPLRSVPLVRIAASGKSRGRLKLSLPRLGPGFHRLAIRARLRVAGDPCLRVHEDDAWVRLHDDAAVTWTRRRRPKGSVGPHLATWAQGLAAVHGGHVHVHPATTGGDASARAFIELDHQLRALGLFPGSRSDAAQVFLATLERVPAGHSYRVAADRLRDAPLLRAGVVWDEEGLRLLGRDGEALTDLVRMLGDARARELCAATECWLGAYTRKDAQGTAEDRADEPGPGELRVLDLASAGHPRGWLAAGAGNHSLMIRWEKPPSVTVRGWPTLVLHMRRPLGGPLDRGRSRLSIKLNGTPLAD